MSICENKYWTVMRNPEMLKRVTDHLRTKKMCKHVVKKLPDLLRYVTDQYQTQQLCDKSILENGGTLKSVPDCCKSQELCSVIMLLIIILMHRNLLLNAIRLKKCVIKQVIDAFLCDSVPDQLQNPRNM